MSLENSVHDMLQNTPALKKIVKRVYQGANVAVFRPRKSDGKVIRVTPDDEYEYLFGYYDKSPWDASGRYMLGLRVKDASRSAAPREKAEIVLIDTEEENQIKILAKTKTWNVQQGAMLGWLGPDFKTEIFYNDFRDGKFHGVIKNVETGAERILERPVYSVSNDGKVALSLDFARLHRLRPGYGYSNLEDETKGEKVPEGPCVWRIDLKTGKATPVLTYRALYDFKHRKDMEGAEHKVNHLMMSPDGKRFMVIHRWLKGGRKVSRLLTCDIDGGDLYNLLDEDMVSHCYWKNNKEILAYCRKNGKNGYYLLKDKTEAFEQKWPWITTDGHPSYSPDKKLVVTDTYPNRKRLSTLRVLSDDASFILTKVYSPFEYDNDVRCDLHPRWSRDGKKICFDGCFEGKRGIYVVEVGENIRNVAKCGEKTNGKIKIMYLMTSCRKSGPSEQTLNIIKNLDRKKFEPILVTIYEEQLDSRINDYLPYVSAHYTVPMSKKNIYLDRDGKMQVFLAKEKPDIIHSVGAFPDYLISSIGFEKHILTLRNYAYEDYLAKFGRVKGWLLAEMQIAATKNARVVVACSESLQKIYKKKLKIDTLCVQNGVDLEKYTKTTDEKKAAVRKRLGFSKTDFVWVYSGQFIARKNIPFILDGFLKICGKNDKMLLLGDGDEFNELKEKYGRNKNLCFLGSVDNVSDYLDAGDVYVSASRSEGLPNGVLEAMVKGLPVVLSNIPQHGEILPNGEDDGGLTFTLDDMSDYVDKMKKIREMDTRKLGEVARKNVKEKFSAEVMSKKYQEIYENMEDGEI